MGFVHGYQADWQTRKAFSKCLGLKAFRRHIEEMVGSELAVVQRNLLLLGSHARVNGGGTNVPTIEVLHLVLHEGDEGCHHKAESVHHHRGYLEAQTLATARGHECQGVATVKYRLNNFRL